MGGDHTKLDLTLSSFVILDVFFSSIIFYQNMHGYGNVYNLALTTWLPMIRHVQIQVQHVAGFHI